MTVSFKCIFYWSFEITLLWMLVCLSGIVEYSNDALTIPHSLIICMLFRSTSFPDLIDLVPTYCSWLIRSLSKTIVRWKARFQAKSKTMLNELSLLCGGWWWVISHSFPISTKYYQPCIRMKAIHRSRLLERILDPFALVPCPKCTIVIHLAHPTTFYSFLLFVLFSLRP